MDIYDPKFTEYEIERQSKVLKSRLKSALISEIYRVMANEKDFENIGWLSEDSKILIFAKYIHAIQSAFDV
jgi:hypothetical protein